MSKWNVHFWVRLTYDVEVEAETEEEAIQKATPEWENANYSEMDYADDDVDAWTER